MAPRKKIHSAIQSNTTSTTSSAYPSRAPSPTPRQAFRFFDLPSELRLRIYEEVLYVRDPIDLDPANYRAIHPRLGLFLASHRLHEEAYRVFYSQVLRLFPLHGRFFHTKTPLIARLPARYRAAIYSLELRLGPGWSAPPRSQKITDSLGLRDCISLKVLRIFVELDPSDSIFTGFRGREATEDTYKWFCIDLLRGIVEQVPRLETVEIDAFPSVKKDAPLIIGLRREVEQAGLRLTWGPLRGWPKDAPTSNVGLVNAMARMGLIDVQTMPRVVEVQS
ncbi:hypothetical protein LTR56_010091 [Elasticomyces elasticus]|nr:hypothetical protein LTR56_010091 [Elasticomyces elasticus]KAK3658918.1 hypothetical protein LTR22_008743 [Elasticomyces elasticus]KAK5758046.1 hypothetical protein LTS12_011806 [Elasticomyces elasticus]